MQKWDLPKVNRTHPRPICGIPTANGLLATRVQCRSGTCQKSIAPIQDPSVGFPRRMDFWQHVYNAEVGPAKSQSHPSKTHLWDSHGEWTSGNTCTMQKWDLPKVNRTHPRPICGIPT